MQSWPSGGIDGAGERGKFEGARHADDRGLRFDSAVDEQHREEFRAAEAEVYQRVVERPHLGVEQPEQRDRGRVDRVRNPRERVGDRRGIFLLGNWISGGVSGGAWWDWDEVGVKESILRGRWVRMRRVTLERRRQGGF